MRSFKLSAFKLANPAYYGPAKPGTCEERSVRRDKRRVRRHERERKQ